jgi:hypothetical protein
MAITIVGAARGVFSASGKTLTMATPAGAAIGDVLLALVGHNAGDAAGAAPAGWTLVALLGSGADTLNLYTRMLDGTELAAVAFSATTVASEWQGELVALRGTSPAVLIEATSSTASSASTSLTTAGVTSQQAISVILAIWTCSGAPALTLPVGFTAVDSFASAVVSSRSMLVGSRIAGATGALALAAATASASTSGRSFVLVLRDRAPLRPAGLVDPVPGNIGLLAKDTRPPR